MMWQRRVATRSSKPGSCVRHTCTIYGKQMNSESLRESFGPGMRTAFPSRALQNTTNTHSKFLGENLLSLPISHLLGKKLVHLMRISRICDANSVSLNSGEPLAIRHHFSCGSCCNDRHPSIPIAQQRVLGLTIFWFHSSFNCKTYTHTLLLPLNCNQTSVDQVLPRKT